jgi:hypothetical protein
VDVELFQCYQQLDDLQTKRALLANPNLSRPFPRFLFQLWRKFGASHRAARSEPHDANPRRPPRSTLWSPEESRTLAGTIAAAPQGLQTWIEFFAVVKIL